MARIDLVMVNTTPAIAQGFAYEGETIRTVLLLQADYLAAIGAIGDAAT